MTRTARHLRSIPAPATREEAAAIVAAIERFLAEHAPPPDERAPATHDGWREAALLEGVAREPRASLQELELRASWINT